ncbi:MAG: glycosyltransferase [Treponema sp.]|nr:MAG: glycosyltransferase [Treponema sp.]
MEKPYISVVMVSYFHEKYIEKAIESVLSQTLSDKIEILIGDDGSKDSTVEILKRYESKYPFIHIYVHENQGLSANVYDLFMQAKGEYIAVLEGDDYWIDNQKLEKQIKIINDNPCVGTACNSLKVDNDGNELGLWNEKIRSKVLTKWEVQYYQTALCHPSGVMFKNIFLGSDGKFDVIKRASRMGGNHTGLINLLANNGGIYLDSNPMTVWRVLVDPKGKNYSAQKVDKFINYYEAMHKYMDYNDAFSISYDYHIFNQYRMCQKKLKKELISSIGRMGILRAECDRCKAKIYSLFNKFKSNK